MEWKKILESYEEFSTNYYMNEEKEMSHEDYAIAEYIATKEAIKMEKGGK